MAVTTSQIVPQSPRERSSVTVQAALSGRRGLNGAAGAAGVLRSSRGRAAGIGNRVLSHQCPPSGARVDRLRVSERAYRARPSTGEPNFGSMKRVLPPAEQPRDQPGALAEAPLLGGTRFLVREFGFDLLQHPRQWDGEREEGVRYTNQ
jgi:hypothetical protein